MFIAGSSKDYRQFKIERSELLDGLGGRVFKGKIWGEGRRIATFFGLVGVETMGWCSRNLVLSLKLPSSLWASALVPLEKFKDIFVCVSLEEEPGLYFIAALLLHSFSFVSASPHFPISNCLNLPVGTQGKSRKLKPFTYRQEMGLLYWEGPPGFSGWKVWVVQLLSLLRAS